MASSENRRTGRAIALRVLVAVLGLAFALWLLYLASWHNVAINARSFPPSPAAVREHNFFLGAILGCLIASLLLVLGPLPALLWPRLGRLPGVGYVAVVGFALAAGLLVLVEEFRTEPYGWTHIGVTAGFAYLAWWLHRSARRAEAKSGTSLHSRS